MLLDEPQYEYTLDAIILIYKYTSMVFILVQNLPSKVHENLRLDWLILTAAINNLPLDKAHGYSYMIPPKVVRRRDLPGDMYAEEELRKLVQPEPLQNGAFNYM